MAKRKGPGTSRSLQTSEWDRFVPLWLHGRPESTRITYEPVIEKFREWIGNKPISQLELKNLQDYADTLAGQKPRTIEKKLAALKSLTSFCCKNELIPIDPGRALRLPKIPDDLAERILPAGDIRRIIDTEPKQRNRTLLQTLYYSGIRASEASGLDWKDIQPRGQNTCQISVLGKGGKRRSILLPSLVWKALESIRPKDADRDSPVFLTNGGKRMTRTYVSILVARAARRAGIRGRVSAHFLRHGHASHSLEAGAPLPLVQQTLGHTSLAATSRYLHVRPTDSSAKYLAS